MICKSCSTKVYFSQKKCLIYGHFCYSVYLKCKIESWQEREVKAPNFAGFYSVNMEMCVRNFRPIVRKGQNLAVGHIGFSNLEIFSFLQTS